MFEAAAKAQEAARHLQRDLADDHVRVMYCTSCGYQQNFQQIKTYLEDTFPHLVDRVDGANYDVDPFKMVSGILITSWNVGKGAKRFMHCVALQMLAQFMGYAQATAMVLLVFGEYVSFLSPSFRGFRGCLGLTRVCRA